MGEGNKEVSVLVDRLRGLTRHVGNTDRLEKALVEMVADQ